MFLEFYYKKIFPVEMFYKLNIYYTCKLFVYLSFQFIDCFKYDFYVFSRLFKNLRLNFLVFNNHVECHKRSYMNRRKYAYIINFRSLFLSKTFFFKNLENLITRIFKHFYKFDLAVYLFTLQNGIKLAWSDIYSNLRDLNRIILKRNTLHFRLDIPRLNYYLHIYNNYKVLTNIVFLSFMGFNIFFDKSRSKFNFYSRII